MRTTVHATVCAAVLTGQRPEPQRDRLTCDFATVSRGG